MVEQALCGPANAELFPRDIPQDIEVEAARIVDLLLRRESAGSGSSGSSGPIPSGQEMAEGKKDADGENAASGKGDKTPSTPFLPVDIDSMEMHRPRSVGGEALVLQAMSQLDWPKKLTELGLTGPQRHAIIGNIVARAIEPGSERASYQWLQQHSGLGELIGYDYETMKLARLYEASDHLWRHRRAIEDHLYTQERDLFGWEGMILLYDLTNTFFEGSAAGNPLAQHGRSKEKRSDCPLVTLGLALNAAGFPRRSEVFAGNVVEGKTLKEMLQSLGAMPGEIVVLDAGVATQANIDWLVSEGYHYLVVSRKQKREFVESESVILKDTVDQQIRVQRVEMDNGEVELRCYSKEREQKERGMQREAGKRFEAELRYLSEGLQIKRRLKRYDKVVEKLGKLKQRYRRAAQHYEIVVKADEKSGLATALTWRRQEKGGSQASHPGVYCLRSDLQDWDEERLWTTYTMLTEVESVFRSLKSELGLRPVYHHKAERVKGHLLITLLAYHFVMTVRKQLKTSGIDDSWQTIRRTMGNQHRITVTMHCAEGRTVHIRKATRAEPMQKSIYDALGMGSQPGKVVKTFVSP